MYAMDTLNELSAKLLSRQAVKPNQGITYSEALDLLQVSGSDVLDLLGFANNVRSRCSGDGVSLCSIVNAKSGGCSEDCAFCAQSRYHKSKIELYPMLSPDEIFNAASDAACHGALHFGIVTSGHRSSKQDLENVASAVKLITKETELTVCASLGILSSEQLNHLKSAGLNKYHHNLETAESYFDQICTTHSYSERVEMVKRVKASGLLACSGGIIGLGESAEQRIELAETLLKLDVDSVPINVLVPISGTALSHEPPLPPMEILKTIAIFRLMMPSKVITLAGGREHNLGDLQPLLLTSGANGLLIGNYLTMPGQSPERDKKMIKNLGLHLGTNKRSHESFNNKIR